MIVLCPGIVEQGLWLHYGIDKYVLFVSPTLGIYVYRFDSCRFSTQAHKYKI